MFIVLKCVVNVVKNVYFILHLVSTSHQHGSLRNFFFSCGPTFFCQDVARHSRLVMIHSKNDQSSWEYKVCPNSSITSQSSLDSLLIINANFKT